MFAVNAFVTKKSEAAFDNVPVYEIISVGPNNSFFRLSNGMIEQYKNDQDNMFIYATPIQIAKYKGEEDFYNIVKKSKSFKTLDEYTHYVEGLSKIKDLLSPSNKLSCLNSAVLLTCEDKLTLDALCYSLIGEFSEKIKTTEESDKIKVFDMYLGYFMDKAPPEILVKFTRIATTICNIDFHKASNWEGFSKRFADWIVA